MEIKKKLRVKIAKISAWKNLGKIEHIQDKDQKG